MKRKFQPVMRLHRWWLSLMWHVDDWAFDQGWIPDRLYKVIEHLTVGRSMHGRS